MVEYAVSMLANHANRNRMEGTRYLKVRILTQDAQIIYNWPRNWIVPVQIRGQYLFKFQPPVNLAKQQGECV